MKRYRQSLSLILGFFVILSFTLSANAQEVYMFSDGKLPDDWTVGSGEWEVTDGTLTVDASGGLATIFFGDPDQQNYEISAKITFEAVDENTRWASIIFRAGEEGKRPWSQVPVRFASKERNGIEFAVQTDKGWNVRQSNKIKKPFAFGKSRELRVVVRGTTVEAYLDGKRMIQSSFCIDRDQGCLGLGATGCKVAFDDVTIKLLTPSKAIFSEMKRQPCEVVAHRGYSGIAPENTLVAAREAIRAGATGSEFDLRLSSDGRIILLHDYTVDRTTNGKGKGSELTFDELRKLDAGSWKDKKYAGEKIPTLDETLAVLKDTGCVPVIEIKVEGISKEVIDAVRRAGMVDQAVVITSPKIVREIRKLEPKIPCYLCTKFNVEGTPKQQAAKIAAEAAKCNTNLVDLYYGMLSPEVVRELKARGIKVWCWTVDNPVEMDALMRWGVDGITTNYPNEVVRLLKEIKK